MTNVVPMRALAKKFATSYSRLKNFETCPRRYHEVDVLKTFKEAESDNLQWGNSVHKAFEDRLARHKPFPHTMKRYEADAAALEEIARQGASMHVEMKLAFDRNFQGTGYFDQGTWFRGKADVLLLAPPNAWAIDWKTGQVKEDSSQLALMAQCIFANYPEIENIGTTFVWLGAGENGASLYTTEEFNQQKMVGVWANLWPRFQLLMHAHEHDLFPPKESGLCKRYCPVTSCKFNGNYG